MSRHAVLGTIVLMAASCAHRGLEWPDRDIEHEVFEPRGEQPLVAMERRGCFGSCPAYRVEGFADGRVVYFGIGYVLTHGERTYRVAPEKVRQAAETLASTGFRSDPKQVDGGFTDMLEFYLFDALPRPKLVRYDNMNPEFGDVSDAAQQIDLLLETQQWVGTRPQQKP